MPKAFCHHCGKEVVYGSRFCNSCGTNLQSLSSKPEPQPTFVPFSPDKNEDDEDGNYLDNIRSFSPKLDRLELEGSNQRPQQKETVGGLLAQGNSFQTQNRGPGRYSNVSKDDFLKQFAQEAGPGTRQEEIGK